MAIRVDLTKDEVAEALQKSLDSHKRFQNSTKNPQFKDIAAITAQRLNHALLNLSEVK